MNKSKMVVEIMGFIDDIKIYPTFGGRAQIIKTTIGIANKLKMYKLTQKNCELLYREAKNLRKAAVENGERIAKEKEEEKKTKQR